ncbi:hypothetical protein DK26_16660 [Bosea sp. WAO]|uniref:siderophore-iron reductase FhuF n=1 Tax=Bosea sp. WAO TaxID=406341 RepID=UPI000749D850|nr:siderophore-iron reductase FhuF [Bosea sp. WAO]KUL94566.1 hypothetical protein DK26_16660 [Bosea sp. WAO]
MIAGAHGPQQNPSLATARRLDEVLIGDLSWYQGKVLPDYGGDEVSRAVDLADLPTLADVIDRFASRYPGCDRRTVASLWSQLYFAFVVPPVIASQLVPGPVINSSLDAMGLRLADDGAPVGLACTLAAITPVAKGQGNEIAGFVCGHLAIMVRAISGVTDLAPKLLWQNAAGYLAWAVGAVAGDPCRSREAALHLAADVLADGTRNPIRSFVTLRSEDRKLFPKRRICCLRSGLPGRSSCADCPARRPLATVLAPRPLAETTPQPDAPIAPLSS